ncbi:MAG: hypothetical protein U0746_15690 [Gemmataceae bacterium]
MSRVRRVAFLLIGTCSVAPTYGIDPGLLDEVLAGHESSVAAIHKLYAKANVTQTSQFGTGTVSAECWKSGPDIRLREHLKPGCVIDCLIRGGKQSIVGTADAADGRPADASMRVATRHEKAVQSDLWQYALMVLPTLKKKPPAPVLTFPEAVKARSPSAVKKVTLDSVPTVYAAMTGENGPDRDEIWLDPAVNWLIRKVVRVTEHWKYEYAVTDFTEHAPGLYFPAKVRLVLRYRNHRPLEESVTFTAVSINRPDTPSMPPLPIPSKGVQVVDEVAGTIYTADSAGRPVKTIGPLRYGKNRPLPKPDPNAPRPDDGYSTILAGALAATVVAALAYGAYRQRKAR